MSSVVRVSRHAGVTPRRVATYVDHLLGGPVSRASICRLGVTFVFLLFVPACRTASPGPQSPTQLAASASRTSADVLGRAEIQSVRVNDAYEAVVRFRPEFLSRRSMTAVAYLGGALPVVYVNGVRQGGAEVLRSIPAGTVVEIRYLSATAASSQFGPYHAAGVLAVRTNP